ncbi:MAG: hypothetical protein IT340_10450 [Chloroflexi bacterium]|nr:hypothetical protein [Chloroflexota bacterium]
MRLLDYQTDQPLRQVGVVLTRSEMETLVEQLQAVLLSGVGYARLEDADWGDLDITLVTDDNRAFLHRRIRRLLDDGA